MQKQELKRVDKLNNSGETLVRRNKRGQLMPGSVLNPKGNPGASWYKTKFDKALTQVNNETKQEVFDELLQIMLESIRAGNTDLLKFVLGKVIAGEDNKSGLNVDNLENLTIVVQKTE